MEHVMPRHQPTHKIPMSRMQMTVLTAAWQGLLKSPFDPYRPECHYIRGPGPKWHAKHEGQPSV
jgi:hypothetical protein